MSIKGLHIILPFMKYTWTKTWRRPISLGFSFVQPMMWMLFFGFLFQRYIVTDVNASNIRYIDFLLPGICCMTVLFGASQSGMTFIRDLHTGFLNRILQTPANRTYILFGKIMADAIRLLIQAIIIGLLGLIIGVQLNTSIAGLLIASCTILVFAIAYTSLSSLIALRTGNQETMSSFIHVLNMPIFFTSTALVPARQMPEWLASMTQFNPLSIVANISRNALIDPSSNFDTNGFFILVLMAVLLFLLARLALDHSARLNKQI